MPMPSVKLEHAPESGIYYPVELVGSPEIDSYVPHLPAVLCRSQEEAGEYYSVPFGEEEDYIDARIPLFAQKVGADTFRLALDPLAEEYFPLSVNHGNLLRAPIAQFTVMQSKRIRPVHAHDKDGTSIELGIWQSQALKSLLIGAINSAIYKNLHYSVSKKNLN